MTDIIHPVILCGGSGTRLWPMSRTTLPKQLLPLASSQSLLQETVERVRDPRFAKPLVVCNESQRYLVSDQLVQANAAGCRIVLEPVARNTAPAVALAALLLMEDDAEAIMLVMPSDHIVHDLSAFRAAVARGAAAARDGGLVTFGITPSNAETGYGYIRVGEAWAGAEGCHRVARFIEKPDQETAAALVRSGDNLWNSGIFMFRAATYLAELERLEPAILAAARAALAKSSGSPLSVDADAFAATPAKSIDYAVMERTALAAVVPVDMGWNDVGSWSALWDIGAKDTDGNVLIGDVIADGARNCYVRTEGMLAAVVGLEDAVVVITEDAALVAAKGKAQDVKSVVEILKARSRPEGTSTFHVSRPWGSFRQVDVGDGFQVKRITVNPGAKLSLQFHHHRAEHWIVVHGTARVTRGEESFLLHENQSTYIPIGVWHRLENPGKLPLQLIEVQSGRYLGEDDIVRADDVYGRV